MSNGTMPKKVTPVSGAEMKSYRMSTTSTKMEERTNIEMLVLSVSYITCMSLFRRDSKSPVRRSS